MYKYAGIAFIVAALLGSAYYKGYAHEHDKLIAYQAQIKQIQLDNDIIVKQKDEENVKNAKTITAGYNAYYTKLIAGLHNNAANSGQPTKDSDSTKGADGAKQELGGTCQGSEFYSNALEDVLKLQSWQEWAIRNHLTVE